MLKIAKTGLLFMFVTYLLSSVACSEEKKEDRGFEAYSLGEIYVKGEKTPVTQQTSVTNVITAEDIKATSSRTVAEALSYTPGIRVSTGRKNEPNVSIRGLDQSRVLILIDGVPYYETNYGKLDLNQIPTDNIAKIEITKGAASVLYGANTLGGVVNIITKNATGKPFFEVTGEGGEVDYFRTSASHGMKAGIFNYWLNYSHSQAHGWGMSDDFEPVVGDIYRNRNRAGSAIFEDGGTRNNSDFSNDNFWAKFGIEPSIGSEYYLNFYYITREKGLPTSIIKNTANPVSASKAYFSQFGRIPTYDDWGIDLSGQQIITDKLALKAKLFYHDHVDDYLSNPSPPVSTDTALSRFKDYMIGGSLIGEFQPVEWDTMRLAFNFRGDSHKERGDSNIPFSSFFSFTGSIGLENEFNFAKNFSVVIGGSYDWFKVTQANNSAASGNKYILGDITKPESMDSFNPMIGANYTFPDTTKLFASVARKTRFPTLQQLYSSVATGTQANDKLKPETAINSTVGVSRAFTNLLWGELAFFYNDISDFISRDAAPPFGIYQNTASVEIYGIEVNTEFYPLKDLVLRLGYTFNKASDQSPGAVTDKLLNIPEHKVDMGVQYTVPFIKTRFDINGILMSEVFNQLPTIQNPDPSQTQSVAGFFVLNSRITQKFLKNFEAYIAVNNIFDRNYDIEYGFPAQGRNIFGGITARF